MTRRVRQCAILSFLVPIAFCYAADLRLERSLDAMGTTYTVAVYGDDRYKMDAAVEDAFDEVRRLEGEMSNYLPDSEWSRVNREAADHPVPVSEETFDLISLCLDYSRQTDGAFDITVGPLMKIWGFYRGSGRVPHRSEIRVAMSHVGYRNIVLDPVKRTVSFRKSGVEIDPGGIGKGYAVDRMVSILRARGIRSGFISAGGSSMYAIGAPPGEPGWHVGVRDPKNEKKTVHDFMLKDESMSTSGSYEKFFVAGGKVYSHIMDPRTGFPAQGMLSVSVIAPKTIDSEAWTKPIFVLGRRWAAVHKPKNTSVFLCEDRLEPVCDMLQ
jgi:FAD:protein FMN transferase